MHGGHLWSSEWSMNATTAYTDWIAQLRAIVHYYFYQDTWYELVGRAMFLNNPSPDEDIAYRLFNIYRLGHSRYGP